MQRLMEDIRSGKVEAVVTYKLPTEFPALSATPASSLEDLKARKIIFISATQSIDTSSATGALATDILASFAQFERETDDGGRLTAARMAGRAEKRPVGTAVGIRMGYMTTTRTRRLLTINHEDAQVITKIFHMVVSEGRKSQRK